MQLHVAELFIIFSALLNSNTEKDKMVKELEEKIEFLIEEKRKVWHLFTSQTYF